MLLGDRTTGVPSNPIALARRHRVRLPSISSIATLLARPERAKGTILAVREVFPFFVRAAHVALAYGDRHHPMLPKELLHLPLHIWAGGHIGCRPTLKYRLCVRRLDHTGSDLRRCFKTP